MDFLLFSGSLRAESLNKKLIEVTNAHLATKADCRGSIVDLQPLHIPVYDGDIETKGIPQGVIDLGAAIKKSSGVIIASPEYNGAMAGSLKNTIDWLSRLKPQPFEQKPVLLMTASPGALGGIRALTTSHVPFNVLGSYLFPQMFALAKAHESFDHLMLKDPLQHKKLSDLVDAYIEFVKKVK